MSHRHAMPGLQTSVRQVLKICATVRSYRFVLCLIVAETETLSPPHVRARGDCERLAPAPRAAGGGLESHPGDARPDSQAEINLQGLIVIPEN